MGVLRLFPGPVEERPLEGTYLRHALHRRGGARPFVYTNFIASLDGRISEADERGRRRVPAAIAGPRDWRLYMELLAQAEVLLTGGRHLRAVAAGRHGDLLQLAEAEHPDLVAWRREAGLTPHPTCAAFSASADIPAAALRARHPGRLLVFTCEDAEPARVQALERAEVEVVAAGRGGRVDAAAALAWLAGRGVRTVYSIAGPRLFHALLSAGAVDRLYLTLAHQLLGGAHYDTLLHGAALTPPPRLRLRELHLDREGGREQLFACYERHTAETG